MSIFYSIVVCEVPDEEKWPTDKTIPFYVSFSSDSPLFFLD